MLPDWELGRAAEFARCTTALDQDTPTVVVGESGIGKTTLLRAAAEVSGRTVHEGGALSTLTWLEYLALERALGRSVGNADPAAIAVDVENHVGPGVLLLDDLQWAAPHTLDVVALLARRVGLLTAIRRGTPEANTALDRLVEEGFEVVELAGLRGPAARAVIAEVAPEMGEAAADQLIRRTGGNPLLLRELARTGEATPSLQLAIAARLRALDPRLRETFTLIALAGRPVRVAGIGNEAAAGLAAAGLIDPIDDGAEVVELHNSLLGEAAIELLTPAEERRLHGVLANLIDDDGEAARHHALAGNREQAHVAAMRAAAATDRPGERATHLAVAAGCIDGAASVELRLEAASHLVDAQDWTLLNEVIAPLADAEPEARARAALLRARGAWGAGFPEVLQTSLEEGLALVAGSGSAAEVGLLVERCRVPIFLEGDREAGVRRTAEALRLAAGHDAELTRAEYLHGTALFVDGQSEAAIEHLEHAIARARAADDLSTEMAAANNLLMLHESQGDPARARALAQEYADRSADLGLMMWSRSFRAALSNLEFHAGNYLVVLEDVDDLLAYPLEARTRESLVEVACLALIDLGRIEEALRRVDRLEERPDDWTLTRQVTWVRTQAALWGGRPLRARELCASLLPGPTGDANVAFAHVTQAWAAYDLGLTPDPAPTIDVPGMTAAIPLEVEAIRHLVAGRHEEAVASFDAASAVWTGYHLRGEVRCRWGGGEAARLAGRDDATARLLAAEQIATSHGMVPMLARIHKSLRALGIARSAPRVRSGTALLTGRETNVLELVGSGLTNAEIATRLGVSRHTVVRQITTASTKLGATSRTHAASMLAVGG